MAFDQAKIYIRSGDGGDGLVSFRREKFVPRGGPAGGDGGKGGDIIVKVNPKINTLTYFHRQVHFKAEHGKRGGSTDKTGRGGDDLIIEVPPGTVIRDADTDELLGDLIYPDQILIIAKGGRGGRGNAKFASSSNQAPRIAEKGEAGIERWIKLELKLIADVGIVGMPNAGKSTLLSVISNAKPKIAPYPFTTLEPNLGMVIYDNNDLVFADIPGLIEGAHMGVGLGHSFLRHVQRTRILVHVLDGTNPDVLADYSQINTELALYDEELGKRPQIVVFNKMDMPEAQENWEKFGNKLKAQGVDVMAISAMTQQNTQKLIQRVFELASTLPKHIPQIVADTDKMPLYELPVDEIIFTIERDEDGAFHVKGKRIERAAQMTQWDYDEAVMRFQQILETLGVSAALEKEGVQVGDTVFIGDFELEWSD
ncbi:MAG: GTPase ObgE [Anaerolineae bacterium]|nr:GTPase ObgE [Anaerolineae bacterium]